MPEQMDSRRFPLLAAYGFMETHGLANEAKSIQQSQGRLGSYNSTIRRGRVTVVLERANLLNEFIRSEWPTGLTERGRQELESCRRVYQRFLTQSPTAEDSTKSGDEETLKASAEISRKQIEVADHTRSPDLPAPHDVRAPTARAQNDRLPPSVLDLILGFWSTVFDIALHIVFPYTPPSSAPTSGMAEPTQQEAPDSPVGGDPTAQIGTIADSTTGSKDAPVAPDSGTERPSASTVAGKTPESLTRPVPPDAAESRGEAIMDDDEPVRTDEGGDPNDARESGPLPLSDPDSSLPKPLPRATSMPPELRGGAPRGPRSTAPNRSVIAQVERPQLICGRRGRAFRIGFEGAPVVRAASGEALARDHELQRVVDLDGAYSWQGTDRPPEEIRLPGVLVFQLSADTEGGWKVNRAGAGPNLLVAPIEYELLPPEGVTIVDSPAIGIAGHRAWELQIEEPATAISLSSTSGQRDVPVGRLEIVYDRTPVAASDQGVPVFGPGPPRISVGDHRPARLDCFVIGREDLVGQRKRERIDASEDLSERISSVLRAGGFGWYFIRVYGRDDNGTPALESSTSFWYAPGLSSQTSDAADPMPQYGMHEQIEIDIVHDSMLACLEAKSVAVGGGIPEVLEITPTGRGSLVRVPGAIACDGVDAILRSSDGPTLTLRIPIVRYWWAVTDDSALPGKWACAKVELSPSKFRAESPTRLHVRLPVWLPPRALQVQFRDAPAHNLKWQRDAGIATFRLGDLDGDMRSLNTAACDLFLIATDGAGEEDQAIALRMVPAFACRLCEAGYDNLREAEAHIHDTHLGDLRPRITEYERIARAFNDQNPGERLPSKIHKCTLCPKYFPADDWQSKDGLGVRHMFSCPNLPTSGLPSAPFENMDIDRILALSATDLERDVARVKHLIEGVGDAFGCKWCERVTFGENAANDHVFSNHRSRLYGAH